MPVLRLSPVQACDKGPESNCSTATVTVYVTDFNDELPFFDFSTYRTDICHTHLPNMTVIQPVATDRDSSSNSELTYTLDDVSITPTLAILCSCHIVLLSYCAPQETELTVMPDSGRVHLVMGVAPEDVGSEFTAVITARDGGNPTLSGTARVIVRVLNCSQDPFR